MRYFDAYTRPPHEPRSRSYHACQHCFICILVRCLCGSEVIVISIHEERNQNLWFCNNVVLVRYFDAYTPPPHEPWSRGYHACQHCFICVLVRCLCGSEVIVTSIHEEHNLNLGICNKVVLVRYFDAYTTIKRLSRVPALLYIHVGKMSMWFRSHCNKYSWRT